MTERDAAIEAAARRSYEYEGDRKSIAYVGWDNEPENVRREWRDSVTTAIAAYEQERAKDEAVAWRCKDYGDAWIYYRTLAAAEEYQHEYGCLMEPVYRHPSPAADVKALREALKAAEYYIDRLYKAHAGQVRVSDLDEAGEPHRLAFPNWRSPMPSEKSMEKAADRLDAALCNFCNGADDAYTPAEWAEETKRNFKELCNAYDEAHSAGLFDIATALDEAKAERTEEIIAVMERRRNSITKATAVRDMMMVFLGELRAKFLSEIEDR